MRWNVRTLVDSKLSHQNDSIFVTRSDKLYAKSGEQRHHCADRITIHVMKHIHVMIKFFHANWPWFDFSQVTEHKMCVISCEEENIRPIRYSRHVQTSPNRTRVYVRINKNNLQVKFDDYLNFSIKRTLSIDSSKAEVTWTSNFVQNTPTRFSLVTWIRISGSGFMNTLLTYSFGFHCHINQSGDTYSSSHSIEVWLTGTTFISSYKKYYLICENR